MYLHSLYTHIHIHKPTYINTYTRIYIKTCNYNNSSYIDYITKIIHFYLFKYLRCSRYKVKNNTKK